MLSIFSKRSRAGFTLVEILIAVAIIGIIIAIVIPNLRGSSEKSRKIICIANLKQIDTAIDQWVLAENISPGVGITESDVETMCENNIKGGLPQCPNGGTYSFHVVGVSPQVTCSFAEKGHALAESE